MTPRQLALVVGAGTVCAIVLPYREGGVALVLTGLAVAAAVVVGRSSDDAGAFGRNVWRRTFAALAVALAVLPAVTDAAWLLALTVPASAGLGLLAVAGGRSWFGAVLPALRTIVLTFTGLGAAARALQRALPVAGRWGRHVRTVLLTVTLVLLFGALFRSADAAFAGIVDVVIPDLSLESLVLRVIVGGVFASGTLTLVLSRSRPEDDEVAAPRTRLTASEWTVPLAALVTLFAAFVLVQAGTLFGGDALVQRTAGLTYAAYAREGFAQLLVVAILTLGVVAAVARYAVPRDERDARLRRGLLATLCVLTLVVLVSSFQRLALYEATFGFTRARMTAHATIVWLGVLFVLVLVLGGLRRADHLPRAAVGWTGVALLIFVLLRPDAIVARANLDHLGASDELDLEVLRGLSDDAVPALVDGLPADVAACVVGPPSDDDPLAWNLARARADAARATLPTVDCSSVSYLSW